MSFEPQRRMGAAEKLGDTVFEACLTWNIVPRAIDTDFHNRVADEIVAITRSTSVFSSGYESGVLIFSTIVAMGRSEQQETRRCKLPIFPGDCLLPPG
jgi:hypothetical protein